MSWWGVWWESWGFPFSGHLYHFFYTFCLFSSLGPCMCLKSTTSSYTFTISGLSISGHAYQKILLFLLLLLGYTFHRHQSLVHLYIFPISLVLTYGFGRTFNPSISSEYSNINVRFASFFGYEYLSSRMWCCTVW
jgi:hypothetical protein